MNDSLKRLIVGAVTALTIILNKKLGLNLGEVEIGTLGGLVGAYLLQSGYKAGKVAEAAAATEPAPEA